MTEALSMWTIYERPKDFPNHFVVRRWIVEGGKQKAHECQLAESLEEARKLIPEGLHRLHRFQEDDPVIVETWL